MITLTVVNFVFSLNEKKLAIFDYTLCARNRDPHIQTNQTDFFASLALTEWLITLKLRHEHKIKGRACIIGRTFMFAVTPSSLRDGHNPWHTLTGGRFYFPWAMLH
jgi:hypothetical protein